MKTFIVKNAVVQIGWEPLYMFMYTCESVCECVICIYVFFAKNTTTIADWQATCCKCLMSMLCGLLRAVKYEFRGS